MVQSLEKIKNKLSEYDKNAVRIISMTRLRLEKDNIGFLECLFFQKIHKFNEKGFDKELEIKEVEKERKII